MKSAKQLFAAAVTPLALTLVLSSPAQSSTAAGIAALGAAGGGGGTTQSGEQGNVTALGYVVVDTPINFYDASLGYKRGKRLLLSFEEYVTSKRASTFSANVVEVDSSQTVLSLDSYVQSYNREPFTVPFSFCEVDRILNDAKKKGVTANFTQKNWPKLREQLSKNTLTPMDCAP